ncbi:MAG: sugar kinase [Lentisphaeria bacterium]|nr:sugar kinase [Lentisphaeria bacterium]
MDSARAFAPGNISCVFKVVAHDDPARMHSLGMGFTVAEGATVSVCPASATAVVFNGESIEFPTVVRVVQMLTPASLAVDISTPLPLSTGFGLSGASALATAYAVNELLDLTLAEEALAMSAHIAEVENLTGLGDVCAQFHGGCLAKLRVGNPLSAVSLPVAEQPIYYRYFGPIRTDEVLRSAEQKRRINQAADTVLDKIEGLLEQTSVDLDACIRLSKSFAVDSGLLSDERVQQSIAEVESSGGSASMIMLGNAVFSTTAFTGAIETRLTRQRGRLLP